MQNTLLVGLSRQVVLERQMDVVANNVANANTNGFANLAPAAAFWLSPETATTLFGAPANASALIVTGGMPSPGPSPI